MPAIRWTQILQNLAPYTPVFLIYLLGIILAFVSWRRHPTVSLLAFLGCGILLLAGAAMLIWFSLLPELAYDKWHMQEDEVQRLYTLSRVAWSLLEVVGFGMILMALFSGRSGLRNR